MRMARAGAFPGPIKLGGAANCAVRFVAEEVEAWIATRLSARATEAHAGLRVSDEPSVAAPGAAKNNAQAN